MANVKFSLSCVIMQCMQSAILFYQCLSVCLSVECRYCVKTNGHHRHTFLTFWWGIILVFFSSRRYKIPRGIPSASALNTRAGNFVYKYCKAVVFIR